jgi:succinate dehydrogenase / fumarate reductase, cytochrome b subunit
VKHNRPVNLDLTTLKFPPMAIVSILHRISGVVLFLLLPFMLYLLNLSLASSASFAKLSIGPVCWVYKVLIWGFCSALIYHALAGIRHLLMDYGFGETVVAGRKSALLTIILAAILIIGLGVWI